MCFQAILVERTEMRREETASLMRRFLQLDGGGGSEGLSWWRVACEEERKESPAVGHGWDSESRDKARLPAASEYK